MHVFRDVLVVNLILFFVACGNTEDSKPKSKTNEMNSHGKTVENENEEDENDGPPFNQSCKCNFKPLGRINVSKERQDLFLSGKGWGWGLPDCAWTWQEIYNNEFPDNQDSLITDFRIHLIDTSGILVDTSFVNSGVFKKIQIATYFRRNDKCSYDPNNTGKYPKPSRWVEEE